MKIVTVSFRNLWITLIKIEETIPLDFYKNHIQFYVGDYITPT